MQQTCGSGKRDDTRSQNCAQDLFPALGWRLFRTHTCLNCVFETPRCDNTSSRCDSVNAQTLCSLGDQALEHRLEACTVLRSAPTYGALDLYPALGWRHFGSTPTSLTALRKSVHGSWVGARMRNPGFVPRPELAASLTMHKPCASRLIRRS